MQAMREFLFVFLDTQDRTGGLFAVKQEIHEKVSREKQGALGKTPLSATIRLI